MKVNRLAPYVSYYTDLVSVSPQEVIDFLESYGGWESNDEDANVPRNISIVDTEYSKLLNDMIYRASKDYAKFYKIPSVQPPHPENRVSKHLPDFGIVTHTDTIPPECDICFTCLIYINSDYEGGELSFVIREGDPIKSGNADLGIKVGRHPEDPMNQGLIDFWFKPEDMSVLIFPPLQPYYHTAHKVKSGYKYMVKGFWIAVEKSPDSN